MVKASAYNVGNPSSIPGSGRSHGEGNGNSLQYSCLEKSHGQRSLVGYSPWGRKVLDILSNFTFTFTFSSPLEYIYGRRQWHPTAVLLPGKSHGRRSLVGCGPWGR